jgi:hypothetical protein
MQRWPPRSHCFFSTVAFIFVSVLSSSPLITERGINSLNLSSLDCGLVSFYPGTAASEIGDSQNRAGGKIIKLSAQ